jgi:hypothetical protein
VISTPALAIDGAYIGDWTPEPGKCDFSGFGPFRITAKGMEGHEESCTTKHAKSDNDGLRVQLSCAAEGRTYDLALRWKIMPDGHLRETTKKKVVDYVRCKPPAVTAASPAAAVSPTVAASPSAGEIKTKFRNGKAIAIARLNTDETCMSGTITGTIVKREFAENGVILRSFVYEAPDGTRGFVNVDPVPESMGLAQAGDVQNALQQLTKVGRPFRAEVRYCGAGGGFLYLENLS